MLPKKTLLSILIVVLTITTLGIPFTKWGFKTDDWGNVYHSIIHSWQDFFNLFTEGNSETVFHPSNLPPGPQAFFQGLYRPVSFIYYYLQYCLFGTNPYGYFLVTITLHALNAALLFHIFCHCANITAAFLAALFFAFHPSLWNWIGWTSAQTYFIELFVLLLILLSLHSYLTTEKFRYYLYACLLFLSNIFLKEQTIFLPVWIMGACYFYNKAIARKNSWLQALKISSGFLLVSIFYIITRLHFFPLTKATGTLTFQPTMHSFITRMSSRLFDFVTYANDILGLSWLGNGNPLLKGSIIGTILAFLAWLFIKSRHKAAVIFCFLSMLLFSWPALLMHYQPRYISLALPWSLLIVLILILKQVQDDKKRMSLSGFVILNLFQDPFLHIKKINSQRMQYVATLAITLLITFNACFLIRHLTARQEVLHTITTAFQKLVADQRTTNRTLCFLALPQRWFHQGSTQAVWMLRKDESKPVYQFNTPINPIDGILDDNYVTFTPIKNGFICTSRNTEKLWFTDPDDKKSAATTIIIEEQFLQDSPLFVVWDYKNQQFRILDEKTL